MNVFLFAGLLLIIAIYSGRFFHKLKLPVITGYIIIGFLSVNIFYVNCYFFKNIDLY